jgi:D-serine deaminase-like pyridoxal phosphate-dependent protein
MDPFADIIKPTLVLDEAAAMLNIHRMAGKARQQKIRFRPHFKTHQSAEIGEWFRQVGVTAITTSSIDMALYFADHGWEDILIAFPANLRQSAALCELAERVKLSLLIENREAAQHLEQVLPDLWRPGSRSMPGQDEPGWHGRIQPPFRNWRANSIRCGKCDCAGC